MTAFSSERCDSGDLNSEEACIAFLYQMKWPNGFKCPHCSYSHAYTISTRRLPLFECSGCGHQTSLITDTVMEGSRTPLVKWFRAIELVSDRTHGINALTLKGEISVTYKTAWSMLHKIRQALAAEQREASLPGDVVIHDASYGRPPGVSTLDIHSRESILLVGASLMEDEQVGRILFQVIDSPRHMRQGTLLPVSVEDFLEEHDIDPNCLVNCQIQRYSPRKNKRLVPFVKEAKRWLTDTFYGIGKKYLQLYMHEFCCRVNLELARIPVFKGISQICTGKSCLQ